MVGLGDFAGMIKKKIEIFCQDETAAPVCAADKISRSINLKISNSSPIYA